MNTGAIAGIIIGAIIVVALLVLAGMMARRSQLRRRRELAEQRWQEAEVRTARAERREAEVAERQARAAQEQAIAREHAARAHGDRRAAVEQEATARRLDPDHPGHTDGDTPDARAEVASTRGTTGEDGEAGQPRGLGRLARFGRRKTTVAAADSGPWQRPGYAPPPEHAADTDGQDEGGDVR